MTATSQTIPSGFRQTEVGVIPDDQLAGSLKTSKSSQSKLSYRKDFSGL